MTSANPNLHKNGAPRIVVAGSLNMDVVIEVDIPPRMGETVLGRKVHFLPGGKGANQAVAAARLDAAVTMLGAVGNDAFGKQLLEAMRQANIGPETIRVIDDESTGMASIMLSRGDNCITVVPGANARLSASDIDRHEQSIRNADIVLLQLEVPVDTVAYTAAAAKRHGKPVVLNPAPALALPDELYAHVDYLTPNRSELALLADMPAAAEPDAGPDALAAAMRRLRERGARHIIVTLGADGAGVLRPDGSVAVVPGRRMPVVDTTGAGDCFNAALAFAIASGREPERAVAFAIAASALSVTRLGAQAGMPALADVKALLDQA